MANMKLAKDILIDRHIPRMIIVIHDLCKKENNMQKNEEQRGPVVGWRAKALGWN
jgi:hypothetical protein